MEAMVEAEEVFGVDLMPRKSKNGITHFEGLGDGPVGVHEIKSKFNAEIESRSEDEDEEHAEQYGDDDSNGNINGGSHKGSEIRDGLSKMEDQMVSDLFPTENISDQIVEDDNTPKSSLENDQEYLENQKDESTCIFSTVKPETLNGYQVDQVIVVNNHRNGIIKPDESAVVEEFKEETLEFDVEKVLEKQETHDLFCPNCHSCITKRVILRRRKRKIQEISSPTEEIDIPEPVPNPPPQEPEITEEPEREAIRCLSCFSIFIPLGRGFKLFTFGGRRSKETVHDAPQISTLDTPASVPATETAGTGQGQLIVSASERSPHNSQQELLPEQVGEPPLLSSGVQEISIAVDANTKPQLAKVDSMTLPAEQTLTTKLEADVNNISGAAAVIDGKEAAMGQQDGLQIVIHRDDAPSVPSTVDPSKVVMGTENVDTGKQVVVSVTEEPDQTVVSVTLPTHTSPETEPLLPPGGTNTSAVSTAPPTPVAGIAAGISQLDIIRSIVYGGLLESIASLSIVTSAAGANAKTLNILALGAANMFGGLFILAHNLRVMKHENNNERYEEVLGEPGHFPLHSTFAVLSYLVFGLLPPVIYGFTFRESDNRDYKLITVALVSLLCITILSLGKAYARRPPKAYLKTLTYYLGLFVMVCGVSYVAGDLFDLLLQKLGLFESSSSVALSVGGVRPLKTPWASY